MRLGGGRTIAAFLLAVVFGVTSAGSADEPAAVHAQPIAEATGAEVTGAGSTTAGSTDAEVHLVLTHGPWPAPWRPDRSNRVSGNGNAIALGRALFFDARLSGRGTHACSSCHRPEMGWTDGRPTAKGLALSNRNTLGLLDVRDRRWFGWDGAADSLWAQSIRPILDVREMGASAAHVRAHIAGNPHLRDLYARAFARPIGTASAQEALVGAAKALAAYQETLVSAATRFDAFRSALERGDAKAAGLYPAAALRGLKMFVGAGGCATCHAGASFTKDAFVALDPTAGDAPADKGRAAGIARLLANPFSLHGRHNDDPERAAAWSRATLAQERDTRGAFRVPTLRNLKSTAPYWHDGSRATLSEAIAQHPRPGVRSPLTPDEVADLVAFLETLSP